MSPLGFMLTWFFSQTVVLKSCFIVAMSLAFFAALSSLRRRAK